MRIHITTPLGRILRWTQYVLIAAAVPMLVYCAFVLLDAWIFESRASHEFERLHEQRAADGAASRAGPPAAPEERAPAMPGGLVGRLESRSIGLDAVIGDGIDSTTLRRAAGHIPGTALPGEPGNVGIAAHRDTFFRPLRNIRRDDVITLTTPLRTYKYRVLFTRVVGPMEMSVLDPTANDVLTLITCHPFYFVGAAPNRFIVRAERVTEEATEPAGVPRTVAR